MRWLHGLKDLLDSLFRREREERALDDEICFHIEMETDKLLRMGMAPDAARREAHRRFGGVERAKERARDERGTRGLDDALGDVRYALRTLGRSPTSTAVAVLTLALGIGATTAMFSVVDGVLLRPLPYPDPERLATVWEVGDDGDRLPTSWLNFSDWRAGAPAFSALAAYTPASPRTVLTRDGGVRARVTTVSADFFAVAGSAPVTGRVFDGRENQPGGPPVAVVSRGFWSDALGAPADLSGVTVSVLGTPYDVVGVAPSTLDIPDDTDVWLPLERAVPWTVRGNHVVEVVGRLAPGTAIGRAREEVDAVHQRLRALHPDVESPGTAVRALEDEVLGQARRPLLLLLGASGFLLLVACTNVAGHLLARGLGRRRELAVRASLGAGRRRLVRQLMTESLVLAGAGALGAVAVGAGLVALASRLDPGAVPRLAEVTLDGRVLAFTAGAAVLTAVLFGLFPALQLTGGDLAGRLRSGASGVERGVRRSWRLLMAGEVALAVVLLVGAGLTARSLAAILGRDTGFDAAGVVTARVHLPSEKYGTQEEATLALDGILASLRQSPAVRGAGLTLLLPVRGTGSIGGPVLLEGGEESEAVLQYRVADGGYFGALRIPLLAGRLFDGGDRPGTPHVAVVDEVTADRLWPGEDPLGKRFNPRGMDPWPDEWLTVIGIVGEVRAWNQDAGTNPTYYVAHRQRPAFLGYFGMDVVASGRDTDRVAMRLRDAIRTTDPDIPLAVTTLDSALAGSAADRRFTGFVLGAFALVALLLAAAGVYGVVSYTVARRTREIGIRVALGAAPSRVSASVRAGAVTLAAGGAAVGLAVAATGSRVMEGLLFGVSPLDPWTYGGVAGVLVVTALVASWVPARRSARIDPSVALRAE